MRFLILKSKSICYNSTYYFADCLAAAFQKLGHESVIFELEGKSLAELQAVTKENFDAVFDFNSKVPQGLDDETMDYYLDEFDAPFFDYLLDHPLYQHDNLKEKLKNFHVICLDSDHADYIRQYYPHIRSVHTLPLGAMPEDMAPDIPFADHVPPAGGSPMPGSTTGELGGAPALGSSPDIPFADRCFDLLFTGTYTDPEEVMHIIDNCEPSLANDMHKLIDALKNDFSLRVDEVFSNLLAAKEIVLPPPTFAQYMQLYFLADTYITAYVRDLVLRALAKEHIPVDIFGHGWEKFKCPEKECFRFHGTCDFKDTFSHMANAKAVLNVMPWFKNGSHDRVFSAMRNGAIAISDESGYLAKHIPPETGLITYPLKDLGQLTKKVQDFLVNPAHYEASARDGRRFVLEHHTWENHAKEIVTWVQGGR